MGKRAALGRFLPVPGGAPALIGFLTAGSLAVGAIQGCRDRQTAIVEARWETVPMLRPRFHSTAVKLPDGRVLVAGGEDAALHGLGTRTLVETEVYEPALKRFVAGPSLPSGATPLLAVTGDCLLAIVGSHDSSTITVDIKTGETQQVGPVSVPHGQGTIVTLLDGSVLVFGGGGFESHSVAEIYEPENRRFTRVGDLVVKRLNCPGTLLADGRVLLTGGTSSDRATYNRRIADAEVYDPRRREFTRVGSMHKTRGQHSATRLADGRVLVTGGDSEGEGITSSAEIFDPESGSFRKIAPMRHRRYNHASVLLSDGRVLIIGGEGEGGIHRSAEVFDPGTERFVEARSMEIGRENLTATLLDTGDILVTGGWSGGEGGMAARVHLEPVMGSGPRK